jgi:serine/threonine-protein kinase
VLVGQRLFVADNDGALIKHVLAGPSASPRSRRDDVPAPIDRECMKALSVEADGRHPTALAFAEALEAAAEEAKLPIATPRAVAAYVKALAAHKPIAIPPLPTGVTPHTRVSSAREGGPNAAGEPPIATPPAPTAETSRLSNTNAASGAESQVSSLASAVEPVRLPSGRGRLAGAAMISLGIGAIGALLAVRYLGGGPSSAAAPAPSATAPVAIDDAKAGAADAAAAVSVAPGPTAMPPPPASASAAPAPIVDAPAKAPAAPKAPPKPRIKSDDWRPQGL